MKLNRTIIVVIGLALLALSRVTIAGDFVRIHEDESTATYHYTGVVTFGDAANLRDICETTDKKVAVVIDSPGGAAYEGVALYWMAKRFDVITCPGADFGAYSAAALFWLGGDSAMIEGSIAGFHLAYCDAWNPPGCDTADIDGEFFKCLIDALGRHEAVALWAQMQTALDTHGVNGFVLYAMVDGKIVTTTLKLERPVNEPLVQPAPTVGPTMKD